MLRHSQSLGHRHHALSAASGLQGARHHQCGFCVHARAPRRRRAARRHACAYREIAAATDLPVNADFEGGYAHDPEGVAENVRLCVETGVAGLSIEDFDRRQGQAALRFRSCGGAHEGGARGDRQGRRRCPVHRPRRMLSPVGRPDLDETIRRLKAFAAAGADCLYSPGIRTPEQIAAVVKAAAPKPVNLLMPGALGSHGRPTSSARRAPHQRRRHACARRLGRVHPHGERDRQAKAASTASRRPSASPRSMHSSATT